MSAASATNIKYVKGQMQCQQRKVLKRQELGVNTSLQLQKGRSSTLFVDLCLILLCSLRLCPMLSSSSHRSPADGWWEWQGSGLGTLLRWLMARFDVLSNLPMLLRRRTSSCFKFLLNRLWKSLTNLSKKHSLDFSLWAAKSSHGN